MTEKGSDAQFPAGGLEKARERFLAEEHKLDLEEAHMLSNPTPEDPGKTYPAPDYSDAS